MEQPTFTDEQKANLRRLAEAMRAGAALRPQAKSVLFKKIWSSTNGEQIASCALGAAWEGSHKAFDASRWLMDELSDDFIGLSEIENHFDVTDIPCVNPTTNTPSVVVSVIITMNDRKGYSREMIADWLLTLAQ